MYEHLSPAEINVLLHAVNRYRRDLETALQELGDHTSVSARHIQADLLLLEGLAQRLASQPRERSAA